MKSERVIVFLLKAYLFFCVSFKLVSIIWGNPYPWELREGVGLQMGKYFAEGINPYLFNGINGTPYANYMYGFIIPGMFAVLKIVFGTKYVLACELTTYLAEIIGVVFAYRTMQIKNVSDNASLLACIGVYGGYWRYNAYGGAFPDAYGLTVLLFICYLIAKDENKNKFRPLLYAFLIVVEFYIKQYYVVLAVGIFLYLFLKNRKDSWVFLVSGCIMGITSMAVVRMLMPTFFTSTVLLLGLFNSYNLWRAIKQFIYLAQYYGLAYVTLITLIISAFVEGRRGGQRPDGGLKLGISYEFVQTIVMGLFMLYFGQSDGTFYTYYLQLWIPFLVMATVGLADQNIPNIKLRESWHKVFGSTAVRIAIVLVIMISLTKFIVVTPLTSTQKAEWEKIYGILDSYDSSSIRIKNNALALYCVERELYDESWGHDGVYIDETLDKLAATNYSEWIFPYAKDLTKQYMDFQKASDQKMRLGQYDCVVLSVAEADEKKELMNNYAEVYRTTLWMGKEYADVAVFEKREG